MSLQKIDATLVREGDQIPGLGEVATSNDTGQGRHRRTHIILRSGIIIIVPGGKHKILVERAS